jgi:hypothetical protein
MTRVARFEKADETIPVCIIGLCHDFTAPRDNIDRFDFGVCMAAFDGKDVTTSAAFDDDVKAKTFTLLRADNEEQFAYSMSRYRKITRGRYAGWALSVPEKFTDLAKAALFRQHFYEAHDIKGTFLLRDNLVRPKARIAAAA